MSNTVASNPPFLRPSPLAAVNIGGAIAAVGENASPKEYPCGPPLVRGFLIASLLDGEVKKGTLRVQEGARPTIVRCALLGPPYSTWCSVLKAQSPVAIVGDLANSVFLRSFPVTMKRESQSAFL